jgi:hypothetical protein
VGEELRGITEGIYFEPTESFAYPMMVYSNVAEGEMLTFKYYDSEKDQLSPCEGTLTFYEDMIEANAFESLKLHVKSTQDFEDASGLKNLSLKVYPNPFKDQINIEYTLAEGSKVRVEVFDVLGKVIEILDEHVLNPGTYSTKWDASMHAEGTYFLKLTTEESSAMRKIILIRRILAY